MTKWRGDTASPEPADSMLISLVILLTALDQAVTTNSLCTETIAEQTLSNRKRHALCLNKQEKMMPQLTVFKDLNTQFSNTRDTKWNANFDLYFKNSYLNFNIHYLTSVNFLLRYQSSSHKINFSVPPGYPALGTKLQQQLNCLGIGRLAQCWVSITSKWHRHGGTYNRQADGV